MRLTRRSALAEVALAAGDALRRAGIRAVLTGGACANLWTRGAYTSVDADFVLLAPCDRTEMDLALASLGFKRIRDRYVHPRARTYIEFPSGPLGIGDDFQIRPVLSRRRGVRMLILSATDACRDRLAAYYVWNDRQALRAAAVIASRNQVAFAKILRWSRKEGKESGYDDFMDEVRRLRVARPPKRLARRSRSSP